MENQADRRRPSQGAADAVTKKKAAKPKPKRPKGDYGFVSPTIWLVIGLMFVIGGVVPLIGEIVFTSHSATATATMTGWHSYESSGKNGCGGTAYDPVVAFTTSNGRHATATLSNMLICNKPSKGSTVKIDYDTTNPSNAQFPSASDNWGYSIGAVVLGVVLLLPAIGMYRSTIKTRARGRAGASSGKGGKTGKTGAGGNSSKGGNSGKGAQSRPGRRDPQPSDAARTYVESLKAEYEAEHGDDRG